MATGYLGTSTATSSSSNGAGLINGPTLSYTCPGSGVRYAVVTINGSCSVGGHGASTFGSGEATAGNIVCLGMTGNNTVAGSNTAVASTYTVLLGPNGSWSGTTWANINSSGGTARASLTASVLEVV